ncbi:MAG: TrkH family potassium uptake protein [Gammaproteobacteria bacterium]|nr:TrkH family potassium uptake protein [Gammaproteobacteria bacterium]
MQLAAIQKILGMLLMIFSLSMFPPALVSLIYDDGVIFSFIDAFMMIMGFGLVMWLPVRNYHRELRLRDGFIVVAMFWLVLGTSGSVPLIIADEPVLSFTDAVFESISGLTTTGATVITGLDDLPKSILFYRQQLQWLGGMGIIVLAVAVLPMLGIGGMQLYRAETPGPMKDNKLTPRITETAKALWYIYLGMTVACTLAYWVAGMTFFDALTHSFATVAIGGFSTHDASIGFFESQIIESVAILFMILAGVNFSLHFLAWRNMTVRPYLLDEEFRTYAKGIFAVAGITIAYLYFTHQFEDSQSAIRYGLFQVVSAATTTGFTTTNFSLWPGLLPALLIAISFIGGCAGSTGGGMKVMRVLLLMKQGTREVVRLIHPSAQVTVKIGGNPLDERVIDSVWGFFSLYVLSFIVMSMILSGTGIDLVTAFSAVAACMNNLGPGLGEVAAHYGEINDLAKWVLCFAMLLGRLEIFTLLVLLSPAFWRR